VLSSTLIVMSDRFPASPPSVSAADPDPSPEGLRSDGADEDPIRTLVTRLARRHSSGGDVIERAAILAEGADCTAVVAWIMAHAGQPEHAAAPSSSGGGLHGGRLSHSASAEGRPPARYVLPPGALSQQG